MRYLAIDLGDKRTGLAIGDDESRIATPLHTIEIPVERESGLIEAIASAASEHGAGALVVGLPLNMDGTEGPRASMTRALAARVGAAASLPVHLHDERLTSADADWAMSRSGLSHKQKKARRDALAAAAFLRDFLASLGSDP